MDILFISANSADAYMDIEREQRRLQKLTNANGHSLHLLPAAEIADVEEALAANRTEQFFDVLHFSGHATEEEGLYLRGTGRQQAFLNVQKLKEMLVDSGVGFVVLNACSSEAIAEALSEVVPVVIGTTRKVRDVVARQFTRLFYTAMMEGATVAEALDAVLREQRTSNIPAYRQAGLRTGQVNQREDFQNGKQRQVYI